MPFNSTGTKLDSAKRPIVKKNGIEKKVYDKNKILNEN